MDVDRRRPPADRARCRSTTEARRAEGGGAPGGRRSHDGSAPNRPRASRSAFARCGARRRSSWSTWIAVLRAAFGLPLSAQEGCFPALPVTERRRRSVFESYGRWSAGGWQDPVAAAIAVYRRSS